jgi:hypothetical protein
MEPGSSLLCSQDPAICPYREPDEANPFPISVRDILIFSSHLHLGLMGVFPSGFSIHSIIIHPSAPKSSEWSNILIRVGFINT